MNVVYFKKLIRSGLIYILTHMEVKNNKICYLIEGIGLLLLPFDTCVIFLLNLRRNC